MTSEPKKNKQLLFLVAQPRSGNTLFASIMNQNPEIAATPNSITLEILKDLHLLKQTDVFLNYPDHKSLDNVLDSVFDTYYKDWPQRIIIDRGPVMTEGNFALMQKHFKRPFKCIVLLRDLMDVLASYMQWYTENPDAFPNRYNCKNDDEKLAMIMNKDGAVAKDLEAIKNSYNYKDICHYVKYDDMVTSPEQEFRKIYEFMGEPYFNHRFNNVDQVSVNGLSYDDKIVGSNMHKLFDGPVRKVYNPYIEKIPERIRENMDTSDFSFVFLGQSVLKYQVPLDVYNTINHIYETKYPELKPANKQLVGKIEKEHSLFFNGEDNSKMTKHNHLPDNVLGWFESKFRHYLEWNKIKQYDLHFNSIWVNTMFQHEYNPVHVHQGSLFTGLSSVMILKLPESYGVEYSATDQPQNGRLQILGSANGHFANVDYQPDIKERDFYIFPYDMRHCVYPFNGPGHRRTLAANMDVQYDPIRNRGVS